MVHADAQCFVLLLQLLHQRRESLFNGRLRLLDIIVAQFIDRVERLPAICKIARIHPDFVNIVGASKGNLRCEMNISNDRSRVPILIQTLPDALTRFCFTHALHCDTHNIHAHVGTSLDLCDSSFNIVSQRCCHGLRGDFVIGANWYRTDCDSPCLATLTPLNGLAISAGWKGMCGCNHTLPMLLLRTALSPAAMCDTAYERHYCHATSHKGLRRATPRVHRRCKIRRCSLNHSACMRCSVATTTLQS
mmetsp:Transcript_69574/g.175713  ORF Transcript_69574/g.175713 Transcript_69574/m.175713 type:complete len:248 (+) Transcript_69574:1711-2454(+)